MATPEPHVPPEWSTGLQYKRFESALKLGHFASSVDALLKLSEAFPSASAAIASLLDQISETARHCTGVLPNDPELRRRICQVFDRAGLWVPLSVETMWQNVDDADTTRVRVPMLVTTNDGVQSVVIRELRVRDGTERAVGHRLEECTDDPDLLASVALARAWVGARLGPRAHDAPLELLPAVQSNSLLHGADVSMAVVVTLVAHLMGKRIPPHYAIAGELNTDATLEPQLRTELGRQLWALGERAHVHTLICPDKSFDPTDSPTGRNGLGAVAVKDIEDLLTRVFGQPLNIPKSGSALQKTVQLALPAPRASLESSLGHEEWRLRLTALLVAATRPLSTALLENALLLETEAQLPPGFSVGRELRTWLAWPDDAVVPWPRVVVTREHAFALRTNEERDRFHIDVAGQRLQRAHAALGSILDPVISDPLDRLGTTAYHHALAGDGEARRTAVSTLAERPEPERLHTLAHLIDALATHIPRPDAMAMIEGDLVDSEHETVRAIALALQAVRMPTPIARLAYSIVGAPTPVDRLLAVQAIVTVCMHLVTSAGVAEARRTMRSDPLLARLSVNADLATLFDTASWAFETIEPDASQLILRLADWVRQVTVDPALCTLPRRLDAALHGVGAWAGLLLDPAAHQAPQAAARAERAPLNRLITAARRMLATLEPVFNDHPLVVIDHASTAEAGQLIGPQPLGAVPSCSYGFRSHSPDASDHAHLRLDGLLWPLDPQEDAAVIGFYRGAFAGDLRYWGYAESIDHRMWVPIHHSRSPVPLLCHSPDEAWRERGTTTHIVPDTAWSAAPPDAAEIHNHPYPLATILSALRDRDGADLGQRLAYIDLAVNTLFRLCLLPAISVLFAGKPIVTAHGPLPRPMRPMNMFRALIERLADRSHGVPAHLADLVGFLTDQDTRMSAWQLVDAVERFAHIAGPISDHQDAIEKTEHRLAWLLRRAPWHPHRDLRWYLVAGHHGQGLVSLFGPDSHHLPPDAVNEELHLSPGTVAFLRSDGQLIPFGPTARFEPTNDQDRPQHARTWLLDGVSNKGEASFYAVDFDGRYFDRLETMP